MQNFNKYFAVSEADKKWGIYTLDCGTLHLQNGEQYHFEEHPENYRINWERGRVLKEFQLIYLIKGNGIFESTASGKIKLNAGSILLVYPNIWHRYKPEQNEEWQTYWVGFSGILADGFIQKLKITTGNPVKLIGYQEKIVQVYFDIFETSQTEFSGFQQVLAGEILKLIGLIHAIQRKSEFKQKNIDRIIHEAKLILMQEDYHVSMEQVAANLNMGYASFRKLFKKYTGISPGQYQMQHRINKATNLLNEGKLSIKEIALELNFETPQYFARIFKKKTGKSPVEFSNQS